MDIAEEINYFYYRMALHELQVMNEGDGYHGLSYNSILYLNVIDQIEECTVSKLAQALSITKSGVTLKINELVRQGAVVKTQSEDDRRVHFLTLSPDMKKTIALYDDVLKRIGQKLQSTYSARELALFGEILHTISGYEWGKLS